MNHNMRVLLIGASGFIGQSILNHLPEGVDLTGTYHKNEFSSKGVTIRQLDYLDPTLNWMDLVESYDNIVIAARANATDKVTRDAVSHRTNTAFTRLFEALESCQKRPFLVAINGSLSYGEKAENLVGPASEINPTGFARSYAIGEAPFRKGLDEGRHMAIVRAPWVIGSDSWFPILYLEGSTVPLIGDGKQWMSFVDVNTLSKCIWRILKSKQSGVIHPPLTYRCRQREFATLVGQTWKRKIKRYGFFRLRSMEPQLRESISVSIRLDDGLGNNAESEDSKVKMITLLQRIYSDLS